MNHGVPDGSRLCTLWTAPVAFPLLDASLAGKITPDPALKPLWGHILSSIQDNDARVTFTLPSEAIIRWFILLQGP